MIFLSQFYDFRVSALYICHLIYKVFLTDAKLHFGFIMEIWRPSSHRDTLHKIHSNENANAIHGNSCPMKEKRNGMRNMKLFPRFFFLCRLCVHGVISSICHFPCANFNVMYVINVLICSWCKIAVKKRSWMRPERLQHSMWQSSNNNRWTHMYFYEETTSLLCHFVCNNFIWKK